MVQTVPASPPPRPPSDDPSNRLPWIAFFAALLLIVGAVAAYLWVQSARDPVVAITADPTRSLVTPSARTTATVGAPATLAAPTSPPPTAAPPPTPTRVPVATPPPGATLVGVVPTASQPQAQPVATQPQAAPAPAPPQPGTAPAPAAPPPPAPAPTSAPAATQPPAPTPTPAFSGQVSGPGGLANTRQDLNTAYGSPTGETPGKLIVYKKDNNEYRVEFSPEPDPRTQLLARMLPADGALPLERAIQESRPLLPRDAQPRAPAPEGNDRIVVERFTSPTLARALPAEIWQQRKGQPGDFLVVYMRNAQGAISRIIVGAGDDPNLLVTRSGE